LGIRIRIKGQENEEKEVTFLVDLIYFYNGKV
jgi:hypothetical protein